MGLCGEKVRNSQVTTEADAESMAELGESVLMPCVAVSVAIAVLVLFPTAEAKADDPGGLDPANSGITKDGEVKTGGGGVHCIGGGKRAESPG